MTTNQLTVKIQDALGAVGFEAAVTATGGQRFLYGTERSLVRGVGRRREQPRHHHGTAATTRRTPRPPC
jgi:hypothetical protein